jgi:hypothetical protein
VDAAAVCSAANAAAVLQCCGCSCSAALRWMQLQCCSAVDAAAVLQCCGCSCSAALLWMQLQCCSAADAAAVLCCLRLRWIPGGLLFMSRTVSAGNAHCKLGVNIGTAIYHSLATFTPPNPLMFPGHPMQCNAMA